MSNPATLSEETAVALFRTMLLARELDQKEMELVRQAEAFFHLASSGHEASCALAPHLIRDDWLHCHYRDKALLLARGVTPRTMFDSFLCNNRSSSLGRRMPPFFSDPDLKILSMVTPTGNNALQAVGVAATIKHEVANPVVLCGIGDGTTQQGEVIEAIAEAARNALPVLFVIQDNHWALSTKTQGRTFYSLPDGNADTFYGLPVHHVDGREVPTAFNEFGRHVEGMRNDRKPRLIVFEVERLANHSNADDQSVYRSREDMNQIATNGDPIVRLQAYLLEHGCSAGQLDQIRQEVKQEITESANAAKLAASPSACVTAKLALSDSYLSKSENRGDPSTPELTMREALNGVLRHWLEKDPSVSLFGEDIEDPKGDVFGVTKGLTVAFPGRVKNSPLSESTIVGVSIGRALAGERPVAFLQFADFLPLAFNQIASELGSMYWRTDGTWQCPVIVMIPCGGYRPGLGPFHAQTMDAIAAHTPGIDVVMPSTAGDAAGLLNAAFMSSRPTLFFYPKSCLNLPDQKTSSDVDEHFVPCGKARIVQNGSDVTLVSWGNPIYLCCRAAKLLEAAGIAAEIIDLRTLSPWDEECVLASAAKTGRLVIVHEDNHTCGFGAEVAATVAEKSLEHIVIRRVTRPDTFIPFHFENQLEILPSVRRITAETADLVGFDVEWQIEDEDGSVHIVECLGSGPADDEVVVVEINVTVGQRVEPGDIVAEVEASKSTVEICANTAGVVERIHGEVGETLPVGNPLITIATMEPSVQRKPATQEKVGIPVFRQREEKRASKLEREKVAATSRQSQPCESESPANGMQVVAVSARQRIFNTRLKNSLTEIVPATLARPIDWSLLLEATQSLRRELPDQPIAPFDVLTYAIAQATRDHRAFRSTPIDEGHVRVAEHVNLGIAVSQPNDELVTAVVREADSLSFPQYLRSLHEAVADALSGVDQATDETHITITHLPGLECTSAVPVLVPPAAAVLFIGSHVESVNPQAASLAMTFDHCRINGMEAAKFLAAVVTVINGLRGEHAPEHFDAERTESNLSELDVNQPCEELEKYVHRLACEVLETSQIDIERPLRTQGMDSVRSTEFQLRLEHATKLQLPPNLIWKHPTVSAIAQYLSENLTSETRFASRRQDSSSVGGFELLEVKQQPAAPGQRRFRSQVGLGTYPWIKDYQVAGYTLFPSTAFCELARAAAESIGLKAPICIENMKQLRSLHIASDDSPVLEMLLHEENSGVWRFEIHANNSQPSNGDAGQLLVEGVICPCDAPAESISVDDIKSRCPNEMAQVQIYRELATRGFDFGPAFQGLWNLWSGESEAIGYVEMDGCLKHKSQYVDPAIFESALHACLALVKDDRPSSPPSWQRIVIWKPLPSCLWSHSCLRPSAEGKIDLDFKLADDEGQVCAAVYGLCLQTDANASIEPNSEPMV